MPAGKKSPKKKTVTSKPLKASKARKNNKTGRGAGRKTGAGKATTLGALDDLRVKMRGVQKPQGKVKVQKPPSAR